MTGKEILSAGMEIFTDAAVAVILAAVLLRCLSAWGLPLRLPVFSYPSRHTKGVPDRENPEEKLLPAGKIFLWALALRVLVLLVSLIYLILVAGVPLSQAPSRFSQWDARHYLNLIDQGYRDYMENGQHLFLVFFPAYVWVTKAVRLVLPHTTLAAVTVSTLCYAWACCWVYRIAAKLGGSRVAKDTVLLLSLFPFSFFFGAAMTESLFLLSTAAACWSALERRWFRFGLWGVLAAATRMTGVLVIAFAAAELLKEEQPLAPPVGGSLKRALPRVLKRLPCLLMPLLGTGSYLALNWYVDGDPFAFLVHQEHWYQGGMWIGKVMRYVTGYLWDNWSGSIGMAVWWPTLILFLIGAALLLSGARNETEAPGMTVYGCAYWIANYSLSWLLSAGRYFSCGFVLFFFAARLMEKRPVLRSLVLIGETLLLSIYLSAYLSGAQVM